MGTEDPLNRGQAFNIFNIGEVLGEISSVGEEAKNTYIE